MLVNELGNIIALWVARGVTLAVLEAIRNEVYAIPAPAGRDREVIDQRPKSGWGALLPTRLLRALSAASCTPSAVICPPSWIRRVQSQPDHFDGGAADW
jgi:hypothetical protein